MSPIREAPRPGDQIPALTGVRAIAAFLVFFHHHPTDLLTLGPLLLWWELHIGVTLFFVLSGFMITWRYDGRRGPREPYLRSYFVNRFARIYPLYFALVVPTMLLLGEKSPLVWGLNLTVFTCFDSGIAQAWSLRVEECFYLLAPAIFLLWRRGPAWPLAAAAILLAILYPVATLPVAAGILGPPRYLLLYTFAGRFFEFYVGVWLAKRVARAAPPPTRTRPLAAFTLLGGLGIAAVVFALAEIRHATGTAYLYGLYHPAGIVLNNLVLPVFIAAFYWGLVREPSMLRRILSGRVAGLLGRSSYAFYLIHTGPLLAYLLGVLALGANLLGSRAGAAAQRLPAQPGALFLFVIVLSIGLYLFVERPANRFLRRRWGTPAAAARR
jgi:peptidoglycan/LPS O-acetylase OafA/YrhL